LPQHFYYDDTQQFPMTRDGCNMQLQSAARARANARGERPTYAAAKCIREVGEVAAQHRR